MDQHNIDRLFREKLDHLEVKPSADGWTKVEKQIRPKAFNAYYWIAASVALIMVSWMIWPNASDDTFTPIASEVSYPPSREVATLALPKETVIEPEVKTVAKSSQTPFARLSNSEPEMTVTKEEPKEPILNQQILKDISRLEMESVVALEEVEKPAVIKNETAAVEESVMSSVKITYIASSTKEKLEKPQESDSIGVFKRFIAFTERIDPGDVLADMKTAKDNLLNGGLKNKRDRNSL